MDQHENNAENDSNADQIAKEQVIWRRQTLQTYRNHRKRRMDKPSKVLKIKIQQPKLIYRK